MAPEVNCYFSIVVVPGFPTRLSLIDPSEEYTIDVPNGERVPDVTVACFDSNGNRTGPFGNARWNVILDADGPLQGDDAYPVLTDGTAILKRLFVDLEDSNVVVTHGLTLQWAPPGNCVLSQTQADSSAGASSPRALITLNVTTGHKPQTMEVLSLVEEPYSKLFLDSSACV